MTVNKHKVIQTFFLNEEATSFINRYFESSKIRKNSDEPVSKDYFKNIETYKININLAELKKWLFDGKIAFDSLCSEEILSASSRDQRNVHSLGNSVKYSFKFSKETRSSVVSYCNVQKIFANVAALKAVWDNFFH